MQNYVPRPSDVAEQQSLSAQVVPQQFQEQSAIHSQTRVPSRLDNFYPPKQLTSEAQFKESYILYASYHILYILRETAEEQNITLSHNNLDEIWVNYKEADRIVKEIIELHKKSADKTQAHYTHPYFFKSGRPKEIFISNFTEVE